MTLLDICPMETWEALETELYEKFNLQGSVFNPEGVRITSVKNFSNPLCPAIKAVEKGQTFICAPAYQNMAAIAEQTQAGVAEECDAGLGRIVVPIIVNNELVGTAGGCGLVFEDGEVESFYINKNIDLDEETIEEMAGEIRVMTDQEKDEAVAFIESRVSDILKNADLV